MTNIHQNGHICNESYQARAIRHYQDLRLIFGKDHSLFTHFAPFFQKYSPLDAYYVLREITYLIKTKLDQANSEEVLDDLDQICRVMFLLYAKLDKLSIRNLLEIEMDELLMLIIDYQEPKGIIRDLTCILVAITKSNLVDNYTPFIMDLFEVFYGLIENRSFSTN